MKNVWKFQGFSYSKRKLLPAWPMFEPTHGINYFKQSRGFYPGRRLSNVLTVKHWHVLNRFPLTVYGQECLFDHSGNMQLQVLFIFFSDVK